MATEWTYSPPHNDYYRVDYDGAGQVVYIWASHVRDAATNAAPQPSGAHVRKDSGAETMPPPVDPIIRHQLPNFIPGTPEDGWVDSLDPSYVMRTGREAHDFFRFGRVFSMLYTEPAGATARHSHNDDAFTIVLYGQKAFSQIRRFVVVSVRRNFVLACAISTYGNQATLKHGCHPSEHAVIHNTGVDPGSCYLPGEYGIGKAPIAVNLAHGESLKPTSRIRFGKIYSIEWNVKVKDIGIVHPEYAALLLSHYEEEESRYSVA